MNQRLSVLVSVAIVASANLFLASPAGAQIDNIIVTARKQEENLQDVPLSVSVFTGDQIDRKGINSLDDIIRLTPGLQLTGNFSPQDVRVVVRGLSPTRGRPNVAVLQDGVDISSESVQTAGGSLLINQRLFDLERIEVVKGPQSALYGRSAFAGAINYITRKPSREGLDGRVSVDLGSEGQQEVRVGISGPVTETLALGADYAYWSNDGFFNNSVTGNDIGGFDGKGFAGTALFEPSDKLSFNLRVEYTNDDLDVPPWVTLGADTADIPVVDTSDPAGLGPPVISPLTTTIPVLSGTLPDGDRLDSRQSENPRTNNDYAGTRREIWRTALTAVWDVGPVILKSISHYADADVNQFHDVRRVASAATISTNADGDVVSGYGEVNFDTDTHLFSQEISVASGGDGPINWLVGGLYWDEDVDQLDGGFNCFILVAPIACADSMAEIGTVLPLNPFPWSRDTEHWSAFALVGWQFTDDWKVTVEARYTDEETKVSGPDDTRAYGTTPGFFPDPPFVLTGTTSGDISDDYFAPRGTLEWTPDDGMLYYLSAAKGIKPSGISTLTGGVGGFDPDANEFESEELWVYELGAKTSWRDDTVFLNGAVFFQDFTDKQTSELVPVDAGGVTVSALRPVNASEAEVWGVELDAQWLATENLYLSLAYTYLDTEYTDFKIDSTNAVQITEVGNCAYVTRDFGPACVVSYDGNELPDAAEHSLVGSISYEHQLTSEIDWFAETDVRYEDERYVTDANVRSYDDYWLADARIGLKTAKLEVTVYVKNVFDDDTVKSGVTFLEPYQTTFFPVALVPNAVVATIPDERRYGIRAQYRFGGN